MVFLLPRNTKVFITTENDKLGVQTTGNATVPVVSTTAVGVSGTTKGVGKLGDVTASTNTKDRFRFLEGIEVSGGWEDEEADFFSTSKKYKMNLKKKWEITLTMKHVDEVMSRLSDGGRFGCYGTSELTGGMYNLEEQMSDYGYRIYVYRNGSWDVFAHGSMTPDGHKIEYYPKASAVESVTFSGEYWIKDCKEADIKKVINVDE